MKKKELIQLINKLEEINLDYGSQSRSCIYCHSNIYNNKNKILHKDYCILELLKSKLKLF